MRHYYMTIFASGPEREIQQFDFNFDFALEICPF